MRTWPTPDWNSSPAAWPTCRPRGSPTKPARKMQIWAPRAYANIDFGARTTTLVRPSEALLRGEFHADRLTSEQVEHYKTHLAEEHLPREQQTFDAVDALALETSGLCRQHSFRPAAARDRRGRPRRPGRSGADPAQHGPSCLGTCRAAGRRSCGGALSAGPARVAGTQGGVERST